mmetsp:Transcript_25870/g.45957  ORF Transcript_25870/g.45957 Transcript_25870/m.45957 type:complete len:226 (+) Transcript_25870:417-1094(+)
MTRSVTTRPKTNAALLTIFAVSDSAFSLAAAMLSSVSVRLVASPISRSSLFCASFMTVCSSLGFCATSRSSRTISSVSLTTVSIRCKLTSPISVCIPALSSPFPLSSVVAIAASRLLLTSSSTAAALLSSACNSLSCCSLSCCDREASASAPALLPTKAALAWQDCSSPPSFRTPAIVDSMNETIISPAFDSASDSAEGSGRGQDWDWEPISSMLFLQVSSSDAR